MAITVLLDKELERQLRQDLGDLNQAAKEALLLEAYRRGKLSLGRLAHALGTAALEAEQWLADRGVGPSYGADDFLADCRTLDSLRGSGQP